MQNQSKREIAFDVQLEIALNVNSPKAFFKVYLPLISSPTLSVYKISANTLTTLTRRRYSNCTNYTIVIVPFTKAIPNMRTQVTKACCDPQAAQAQYQGTVELQGFVWEYNGFV